VVVAPACGVRGGVAALLDGRACFVGLLGVVVGGGGVVVKATNGLTSCVKRRPFFCCLFFFRCGGGVGESFVSFVDCSWDVIGRYFVVGWVEEGGG